MSLTKQKYHGKITVTGSTNDQVNWEENPGSGVVNLSTVISANDYYPETLAALIATQMTAASSGITYTAALDNTTGIPTFTASTGGFFFEIKASESRKLLTGGDGAVGTQGTHHLGFLVVASDPVLLASTDNGVGAPAATWYPTQPKATDDEGIATSTVSEAITMGGASKVYDFSGRSSYLTTRALGYEYLSAADRSAFDGEFWPYAKQGEPFEFFDDSTSATSIQHVLTGETLGSPGWARTTPTLSRWSLPLTMRLYKP